MSQSETFVLRIVDNSGTSTPVDTPRPLEGASNLPKCETAAETLRLIQQLKHKLNTEYGDEVKTMKAAQRREYLRNYSRMYYREHREELLARAKEKYYQRKAQSKSASS